jgi:hypothetical protein
MISIVVCQRGLVGGGRWEENDREWIMTKYIASVYEESITKMNCKLMNSREQGNREIVSNRGG